MNMCITAVLRTSSECFIYEQEIPGKKTADVLLAGPEIYLNGTEFLWGAVPVDGFR